MRQPLELERKRTVVHAIYSFRSLINDPSSYLHSQTTNTFITLIFNLNQFS